MSNPVKIWDLATRVFHVALIILVAGAFITVNLGDEWMRLHGQIGLTILSLLIFRVFWGIFGGHWSRFSSFSLKPSLVFAYLRNRSINTQTYPGHNPVGSWSSLTMIVCLLLQAITGLCSDDEVLFSGPLVPLLSEQQVEWVTFYHSEIGQPLIILLVTIHVVAVIFYKFILKNDLITPMITGFKQTLEAFTSSNDSVTMRIFAMISFCIIFSLIWFYLKV